jgi:hypothetical protein
MRLFPRGVFSRNRLDWSTETLMVGTVFNERAFPTPPGVGLYNNSSRGAYLAVLAIAPYLSQSPHIVTSGFNLLGWHGSGSGGTPLDPNNPVIEGQLQTGPQQIQGNGYQQQLWKADGTLISLPGGAPLAIIPPNATWVVAAMVWSAAIITTDHLACTFWWTLYK